MTKIMAESCHAENFSPVRQLVSPLGNNPRHFRMNVERMGHHAENPVSKFHNADGVFKVFMGSPGIDQIRQSQLVNGAQSLKWARINDISLVGVEVGEDMNRIA